jgi:hypothetical protein
VEFKLDDAKIVISEIEDGSKDREHIDENLPEFLDKNSLGDVAYCEQVHGKNIKIISEKGLYPSADGLVTGESIGQVASQTLESMNATGSVVDMPILRPLVGMDKLEIMDRAAAIGTYETSILPYEDCCTVFVPKHPVTHPKLDRIERSEGRLPVDELVEKALAGVEVIEI